MYHQLIRLFFNITTIKPLKQTELTVIYYHLVLVHLEAPQMTQTFFSLNQDLSILLVVFMSLKFLVFSGAPHPCFFPMTLICWGDLVAFPAEASYSAFVSLTVAS